MATKKAPAAAMDVASSPDYAAREQQYQTEEDVRTLTKAHQIKKDAPRHARAKAHVIGMLSAMKGGPAAAPAEPAAAKKA